MSGPLNLTSHVASNGTSGSRNYDYDKQYRRDSQGDEVTENARIWNVYLDEAESYDTDMVQGFRNNIDGLLVFAALFSAVVTTFVAQTSQSLQPDNGQIIASLLYENNQLLRAAGNRTSVDAVPNTALVPGSQTYSSTDLWVNGLFFTSLALSLSTALLTVLAKQWIQAYTVVVSGSAQTRALIRHFRFQGLMKYKLSEIIESLPLILHSSVAIFFIGLALYVSQLSLPICSVVSVITTLTFVFYFATSVLPAYDIACPYRIPFMFSLAKPLVFAFYVAEYAYLELRNTFTRKQIPQTWPDYSRLSFKIAEQKEAFPCYFTLVAERACESIEWLFNHSSNKSVKNIVVEALCALLEGWNSKEHFRRVYFDKVVSSPKHNNLFLSAATYSLSQSSNIPAQSAAEQDLEQSTCCRLISNLMKISSSNNLFDEGLIKLRKSWREEIERAWMLAYGGALQSRYHTLSRRILDWGRPMLQSDWDHSILHTCAACGDAEDIQELVDRGIDLNLHRRGWTALHQAASRGNLDAVIALSQREPGLISAQAIDYFSGKRETALEIAIKHCKPDVVAYLSDHGAQAPPNALHAPV